MKHDNVLVIGGTGFVGRHLAARLVAQGRKVLVPTRHIAKARPLILLPTVDAVEADVHDSAALRRLLEGQDAVINLVGILHDKPVGARSVLRYGKGFAAAHVELPRRLAAACAEMGVARLVHMSALGAAAAAPSMYLRSKADGEAAVLGQAGLAATVFRPSVIFGPDDSFLNLFARLLRLFPVMPLAGATARFAPVYVGDVARAMDLALDVPDTRGAVIELAGPREYTLHELVALAGQWSGHRRPIIDLPPALGRLQTWVIEHLPGPTLMSRDNLDSMRVPNVATQPLAPALARALEFDWPAPLEEIAPHYLSGQSLEGRYDHYRRSPG